jgi:5-methylcytosine-specific restriction endonuclease McrA
VPDVINIERRGGRRNGPPRIAHCGHLVAFHPGPSKNACAECKNPSRYCPTCRDDITALSGRSKFCSKLCREIHSGVVLFGPRNQRVCALDECAIVFFPRRSGAQCCSERHGKMLNKRKSRARGEQKSIWDDRRRNNHYIRKTKMIATAVGSVRLKDILDRDGTDCALCFEPVDFSLSWPDPFSQSLDHAIPISRGGPHILANCQLAHLRCNISKGARVA